MGYYILFSWFVAGTLCLGLYPCKNKDTQTTLDIAMEKAGDNRQELEKVLRHYQQSPADSLKYKAACFLIENMPYYSYPVGKQLDNYKTYFNWLRHYRKKTPRQLSDSIRQFFGPIGELEKKQDIHKIDSAYLCHNIEWAFKVWQEQPWGKHISFATFCEYILPYRIEDEPLKYWREEYYNKFDSLLLPLKNSNSLDKENPVAVANYLIQKLPHKYHRYTGIFPYSFGHIGPEHVQYLTGSCKEVTDFAVYLFRALGIPCAIDFIPVRGNVNASHLWVVCWDKYGKEYMTDFPRELWPTEKNWWYEHDDSPKVYRTTFSLNRTLVEETGYDGEEIYPFWSLPKFTDITHVYGRHYLEQVRIPVSRLYNTPTKGKIAYLCLSYRKRWIPVDRTVYKRGQLIFNKLRKGSVMRIATYENKELEVIGTPGCFQQDGSHEYTNVFDGKSWTSFDYKESEGGWAGLDLGIPTQIDKIVYTPRNRDNYIRPGDTYELFYCDKDWISAGEMQATSDSLHYHQLPQNALLLLCNYTRGTQERIFVYENGSQIWK
ncbi:MAG: discoidin domain-containing protein [Bacteroides acidifaciens]